MVLGTFTILQEHINIVHKPEIKPCKYCEKILYSNETLEEHMIQVHEKIVILHTMGSQVNDLTEKFEDFECFKKKTMKLLKALKSENNEIKQELFVIRNTQQTMQIPNSNILPDKHPDLPKVPKNNSYKDALKDIQVDKNEAAIKIDDYQQTQFEKADIDDIEKTDTKNIAWVGTSLSESLDVYAFERDKNTKVKVTKAYGIVRDAKQLYPDKNFADIVPDVIARDSPDTLVLQAGSIEISSIDVKRALMDDEGDIAEYKKEWFAQVESDSANLFNITEAAIEMKPNLEVFIVKRLPRYDPRTADPIGII